MNLRREPGTGRLAQWMPVRASYDDGAPLPESATWVVVWCQRGSGLSMQHLTADEAATWEPVAFSDEAAQLKRERDEVAEELEQARGRLLTALDMDSSDMPTIDLVDELCAMAGTTPHPFPHTGTCGWCGRRIHYLDATIGWSTLPDRTDNGCPLAPPAYWPEGAHWPTAVSSPNGPMLDPVLLCRCTGDTVHPIGDSEAACQLTEVVAWSAVWRAQARGATTPSGDESPA